MQPANRPLWLRFLTIAQPYFFPRIPGGSWATFLLLMLLVFLFGLLAVIVAGAALVGNHVAPDLTTEVAAGLLFMIAEVLHSKEGLLSLLPLLSPLSSFSPSAGTCAHAGRRGSCW